MDPAFEFEKRRNEPVKYDRELWKSTVEAMKRVDAIRQKRSAQHIFDRWKKAKEIEKEKDRKEVSGLSRLLLLLLSRDTFLSISRDTFRSIVFQVARDIALIKSPAAGLRRAAKAMDTEEAVEEDEEVEMEAEDMDTSIQIASKAGKKAAKAKRAKSQRIVEEIHEGEEPIMLQE